MNELKTLENFSCICFYELVRTAAGFSTSISGTWSGSQPPWNRRLWRPWVNEPGNPWRWRTGPTPSLGVQVGSRGHSYPIAFLAPRKLGRPYFHTLLQTPNWVWWLRLQAHYALSKIKQLIRWPVNNKRHVKKEWNSNFRRPLPLRDDERDVPRGHRPWAGCPFKNITINLLLSPQPVAVLITLLWQENPFPNKVWVAEKRQSQQSGNKLCFQMIEGKLLFSLAALPPSCCSHQTHINTHVTKLPPHRISITAECCALPFWAHFSLCAISVCFAQISPFLSTTAHIRSLPPFLPLPHSTTGSLEPILLSRRILLPHPLNWEPLEIQTLLLFSQWLAQSNHSINAEKVGFYSH